MTLDIIFFPQEINPNVGRLPLNIYQGAREGRLR